MSEHYHNFEVAIYTRVYEVQQMADLNWLRERFDEISRWVKVNKVYLETHRDMVVADEATLRGAMQFFDSRGVRTSGGITVTVNERNRFETYCYTNPEHRTKLKEVVEYTARLFDEVILDDFFFTNCKCERCIQAKGERSWTDFRLELMEQAARELVINPARAVNPKVELVIKYPNWYDHFQGLGFNLESEPKIFDRVYTGTETRDPIAGNQHLQAYHGYSIFRYFDNLKPGANGGGWVDTGGMFTADRYAEQLWLTLFAKAPEVTLFDFRQMQWPLQKTHRAPWQGTGTSFDFDQVTTPVSNPDGSLKPEAMVPLVAGAAFEQVDSFLGLLGKPLGLKSYKPYHSSGEDFLPSYLGMLGITMDIVPEFPAEEAVVLLTEQARYDPAIVGKIKRQLLDGKSVVITSGLLKALNGRGIEDIVELQTSDRKVLVKDFNAGWFQSFSGEKEILIPQIQYLTNDSWEEISGIGPYTGYPLLHSARYANGVLYVLTIPENFSDLYALPAGVLRRIRETLTAGQDVTLDAPAQVALFLYDNHTLIVESFLPEAVDVQLIAAKGFEKLCDLLQGEALSGTPVVDFWGKPDGRTAFKLRLPAHSYRVFQLE